jgi:soluble lytic murein transglycosylase
MNRVNVMVLRIALVLILAGWGGYSDRGAPALQAVDSFADALTPDDIPAAAREMLATDRPWRAALLMRSYAAGRPDLSPDERLLAARAEGASGNWSRVAALLRGHEVALHLEDGWGWYLLGRSLEDGGDPASAVEAYRRFLANAADADETVRQAARLRLALALVSAGRAEEARPELDAVTEYAAEAQPWFRLAEAMAHSGRGDRHEVDAIVDGFDSGLEGLRAWRARIEAARAAGDIAGARALATEARNWASTDGTRAEFALAHARMSAEMGDAAAARSGYLATISLNDAGPWARQAADALLRLDRTPAEDLAVARVLAGQGLHEDAAAHFDSWRRNPDGSASPAEVGVEHAEALFYAERYAEAAEALQAAGTTREARMLLARVEAHRGNSEAAAEIYLELAQQGGDDGALALYLAPATLHDTGHTDRAVPLYEQVVQQHPRSNVGGLAAMRLAGIAYLDGDYDRAVEIWEEARRQHAGGNYATQATYWIGRARLAEGDTAAAAESFRAVRSADRTGYYGWLASRQLGAPFWPPPLEREASADAASREAVARAFRGVDVLREAGFPDEAAIEAMRVADRLGEGRQTQLALAEALIERGHGRRAIRIGQALASDEPRIARLLRILYPLPFERMIRAEAEEHGLDPYVLAALIRQESLFEERATSPVGARGLMQIMPATGTRLAQEAGLEDFDPELLYDPEINVYLGARYVAEHYQEYGGSLPSVFSAYNAGAHRVGRWAAYPEYADEELFTERIPFRETRDYVKILSRNFAIYIGLYGDEGD